MDKGLALIGFSVLLLLAAFIAFERGRLSSKEIPILVTLSAIAALSRIPFAVIPGIQLTTFIVIITGLVFGGLPGFLVGAFATLTSNIVLGHGPWTVFQMLAWGLCGISSGIFRYAKPTKFMLAAFGFFWGFLFGWINNLWYWLAFVKPLTIKSWLVTNLSFSGFDLIHAILNFFLLLTIGTECINILKRFKKKLTFLHS